MAEKTEKATPKKIKDARKKGQVAQTPDIPKVISCLVMFEVLISIIDWAMNELQSMFLLPLLTIGSPFEISYLDVIDGTVTTLLKFTFIIIPIAIISATFGRWIQFGFLFSPDSIKFDIQKINPLSQLKQMFSGRKFTEVLNNIVKSIIIIVVSYLIIRSLIDNILKLPYLSLDNVWVVVINMFHMFERVCLTILLIPAILDFALKLFFHLKQLKMEKQEITREYKDSEGDPLIKSQRKQLGMELAQSAPAQTQKIENSDMLLVNPTHFAVGLCYKPDSTPLPVIVAKGKDAQALDLIKQAHTYNIPVIRYVWLARTLYKQELGGYITRETLQAVAHLYQLIRRLKQESKEEAGFDDFESNI